MVPKSPSPGRHWRKDVPSWPTLQLALLSHWAPCLWWAREQDNCDPLSSCGCLKCFLYIPTRGLSRLLSLAEFLGCSHPYFPRWPELEPTTPEAVGHNHLCTFSSYQSWGFSSHACLGSDRWAVLVLSHWFLFWTITKLPFLLQGVSS